MQPVLDQEVRAAAEVLRRDATALPGGGETTASPSEWQTGFRMDAETPRGDGLTLQGDYFANEAETAALAVLARRAPDGLRIYADLKQALG